MKTDKIIKTGSFVMDLFLVIPIAALIGMETSSALSNAEFNKTLSVIISFVAGVGVSVFGLFAAWIAAGFVSQGKWSRGIFVYILLVTVEGSLATKHVQDGLWILMLVAMMSHVIVGMYMANEKAEESKAEESKMEREKVKEESEIEEMKLKAEWKRLKQESEIKEMKLKAEWEREQEKVAAEREHELRKMELETQALSNQATAQPLPYPIAKPNGRQLIASASRAEPLSMGFGRTQTGAAENNETSIGAEGFDWSLEPNKWTFDQTELAKNMDEKELKSNLIAAGVGESTGRYRIKKLKKQ